MNMQTQQTAQLQQMMIQQQQQSLAITLPQPEVPVFKGDPLEYCSFMRAFETLIERKTASASGRLYYLIQYTQGDAQELVRSCLAMNEEEGYYEAKRLLKNRFGQDYRIACALVERLTKGPAIKGEDGQALDKFSVQLTSCTNTLKQIGYMSKMENPDCLKKLVEKLPFGMRRKWRDVAVRITEDERREISIQDVSKFVAAEARVATHPIFGSLSAVNNHTDSNSKRKPSQKQSSSFAVHGATSNPKNTAAMSEGEKDGVGRKSKECPLCGSNHWLSQCSSFKEKSIGDRRAFVRSKKLCDNCLVGGHFAKACQKASFCKISDCTGKHSTYLHPDNKSQDDRSKDSKSSDDRNKPACSSESHIGLVNAERDASRVTGAGSAAVGLSILPIKVRAEGGKRVVETYGFLDSGSNTSFCTEELMQQLGIEGNPTTLSLTTMQQHNGHVKSSVVSLEVLDLDEVNLVELPTVFSTPKMPVTSSDIPRQKDIEKWQYLKDVKLSQLNANVGLLIGNDVPKALEPQEVKGSRNGGPFAIRTLLGWVVNGPLCRDGKTSHTANFIKADENDLSQQFERFCNQEFNDVSSYGKPSMSVEDKQALSVFEDSAQVKEGHYEVKIPWKNQEPRLPNNRSVAEHRLKLLQRRFSRNKDLSKKYSDFIEDLFLNQYAERVPSEELERSDGRVWYLPHHSVIHPQKPDKTRVVFDCAATYKGVSLNSQVLQGPDLTNNLVGVLLRFREEPVALMADVEAMFH